MRNASRAEADAADLISVDEEAGAEALLLEERAFDGQGFARNRVNNAAAE
jgi:hypothetical protein